MNGIQLIESLNDKGVIINVLNMGIIDGSPTGKLIRNIMLSFAEFERDMIGHFRKLNFYKMIKIKNAAN